MDRRSLIAGLTGAAGLTAAAGVGSLVACQPPREPTDRYGRTRIRFAIDGAAQAAHAGFYQAVANGSYSRRDLTVEIIQGGPSVDVPQLLASGQVELGMGANAFIPMNLTAEGAPVSVVAAFFQKDPQVLIAHPDPALTSIANLAGRPLLLSETAVASVWIWLKARYGFTDDQLRPYTSDPAVFLADPRAVQDGSLTIDPYIIETAGGVEPRVFLLADEGYPSYANLLLAPDGLIRDNRSVVARFIEGSVEGWQSYLNDDPTPAETLIKRANPQMTQELLAWARRNLMANEIVVSPGGRIGDMTAARWEEFFQVAAEAGAYEAGVDWRSAFTLDFLRS
ncbi:MAG: ABC transporter substrate-binding protein [Caulobacterales bacterium]|nr:ABC transporter substrate-binding protein [Caulobacterales bacterium]